jgi:ribosomal protein L37AE/L43A
MVETGVAGLLHECPFCHKHFAAELISRDHVDTSELKAEDFPMVRPPMRGPSLGLRPVTEVYVTFKLNYRCKHCGREWSKISTEEYTGE